MSISPREYLKHIRDEARFLATAVATLDAETFAREEVLKRACVRAIEIIGDFVRREDYCRVFIAIIRVDTHRHDIPLA